MKNIAFTFIFSWLFFSAVSAQIINGTDTLYGNEWINFDQEYFKIMVTEDGMYKVDYQQLNNAGFPVSQVPGNQYQLFHNGEEVPVYTTTDGIFSAADHFEFYGQKNRSELDCYLFENPDEEMMNPLYSLFTDTSAYFLTWTDVGTPLRYEEVENDLSNLPPKEEYYMEELVQNFYSNWTQEGYNFSYESIFNNAEGFCGPLLRESNLTFQLSNFISDGPNPRLTLRMTGNANPHSQEISINDKLWTTLNYYRIDVAAIDSSFSKQELNDQLKVKVYGKNDSDDKHRLSNAILIYPREFNAIQNSFFQFKINPSAVNKYVEVEDFNYSGNGDIVLFDVSNGKRTVVTYENNKVKFSIPASSITREFYLITENQFKETIKINSTTFIDYSKLSADYIILSNEKLFNDGQGNNRVAEYANYRNSMAGGNFETIVVEVQQLYDQFGWGLNRHNLSIRNFGLSIKKEWQEPADYLFIIGKGRTYPSIRTASQINSSGNATFYVPTFGNPGSDVLLMAENDRLAPYLAIGRLPVETPDEIRIYLNKVKEHDGLINTAESTIDDRAWMKRVMHLGGGGPDEQEIIRRNLENMAETLTNSSYGAEVHAFYKFNSDPIQISTNEAIFNLINDGVSVITFYGHSAVNTFDFNIDNPDNYDNKGRYPIMFSLGCYIGGIHTSVKGVSERFVLHDEGAALAFIASTGAGYVSSLNRYTGQAYELMGDDLYGRSIGEIINATNGQLENSNFGDRPLVHQITLNGDPAIKTSIFEGPDYTIDYSTVKLTPGIVNVTADSFQVEFDIVNIGKSSLENDTIEYQIKQEFPDGSEIVLKNGKATVPINRKKIKLNLPTSGEESVGLNKLHIEIDPNDVIEEKPSQAEGNNELRSPITNELGYIFYIQNNGAKAIYPYEFAIVGDQDLTLNASTYDPLVATQKYIFQLDTIETFESPFLMEHELVQSGGVLKWKPGILLEEEEVYYWRVSPDSISPQAGFNWSESSFVFLEGKEGWNQSDFGQYVRNDLDSMQLNYQERGLDFLNIFRDIRVDNQASANAEYRNNNAPWFGMFCWEVSTFNAGVQVVVMYPKSADYWENSPPGEFGSFNNKWDLPSFAFPTSTIAERENLILFLDEIIPDDYLVILYTCQKSVDDDYMSTEWAIDSVSLGKNLYSVLEKQGAKKIRNLQTAPVPYVVMYKKGREIIREEIAENNSSKVTVENSFPRYLNNGNFESKIIGPSSNWNSIKYLLNEVEILPTDSVVISLYGYKSISSFAGTPELLIENIIEEADLSFIDANEYPFLQIQYYAFDHENRTPPNIKNWRILYDPVPEFAIDLAGDFVFHNDTLSQGEKFKIALGVENLSTITSDSVLVKYAYTSTDNEQIVRLERYDEIMGHDRILVESELSTHDLVDLQRIGVEVNPDEDQLELTKSNNYFFDEFYIERDQRNPILDVTFDGKHIMNGDLVSPTSLITIQLRDENDFLLLNDTANINLFLVRPGRITPERISFADPAVTYTLATQNGKNNLTIDYAANLNEQDTLSQAGSGDVQLSDFGNYSFIVQATDRTGNQSGAHDYKVEFLVSNKTAISNFVNYPNPFSTSTRFLYTLTGRETPRNYKLRIMSVAGRIVREVNAIELGELKLGANHLTDFAWDGTDQYGDVLASGVYLYQFVFPDDSEFAENKFENSAVDQYFKSGVGKMVLIR